MYAIVSLQGHQYIVQKGDTIVVDKLEADASSSYDASDVLAVFDEEGKSVKVGKPFVKGAKVSFAVENHQKGDKLHVYKFKNKNRYARKQGFRAHQTVLTVNDIVHGTK